MRNAVVGVVVLAGLMGGVQAQSEDPSGDIAQAAHWLISAKEDLGTAADGIDKDKCPKALALMKKGATVSTGRSLADVGGTEAKYGWTLSVAAAERLCKEVAFYNQVLLADYALFSRMAKELAMLADPTFGEKFGKAGIENATRCVKAVDAMLAGGAKASQPYELKNADGKVVTKTVGELKANLCEKTRTLASKYVKSIDDSRKAYDARLTKAGLAGDKLHWFKHYDGQVFLPGGAAPSDIKKYAAASVWFAYIYGDKPDVNGNHLFTVRRYQFSGNKLTKSTETTYKKPLGFRSSIGSVMK